MTKGMKNIGIHPLCSKNNAYFIFHPITTSKCFRITGYFLLSILLCFSSNSEAQVLDFVRQHEVVVKAEGKNLAFPWVGGFNNLQFSEAHLNQDGILDLFVFDRASNAIMTFTHTGNSEDGVNGYRYTPELEENFPQLEYWALMVDYNCDAIPDIFTSFNNGILVYQGRYEANSKIDFQLAADTLKHGTNQPIFVSEFDLPAITDVNSDGDIDILTFNPSGGFIEYFENLTVENNGTCGNLANYELNTHCWGGMYESFFDRTLTLDTCSQGKRQTLEEGEHMQKTGSPHPGSTLLAIDLDGDTDREIILGDIAFNSLAMATNGGTPEVAAMIAQDIFFPSNNIPVDITTFPAAFSADMNRDGIQDLLVTPNAVAQADYFECVWYYENRGTNENPSFDFQSNRFMVENTIDVGGFSHPVFFDHNQDGLLDLVVGNEGYMVRVSEFSSYINPTLALYENTGTAQTPIFELVTRDYMTLAEQLQSSVPDPSVESAVLYFPTFGDLDNDGDEDLLIGDNMGYIHRFENNPTTEGIAQFTKKAERMTDDTGEPLDAKQRAAPQLVDVNEDGKLDLIVGNNDGRVYYYQNIGTLENPIFRLENKQWGAVFVRPFPDRGHAIPRLFKLNDGNFRLIVGNDAGKLYLYEDIESNIGGGPFTLVTQQLIPLSGVEDASPTTADVDNDGRLDLLIGNFRGGLSWYETASIVGIEENTTQQNTFQIYPNPTQNHLFFDWKNTAFPSTDALEIQIYNTLGQLVLTSNLEQGEKTLPIGGLESGLYLVEVRIGGEWIGGKKLVVR